MAQPRIEDDLKFLWGEVKKGFNFLFDYYKGKNDDYWTDAKVDSWKEGPFPKIKRGAVWALTLSALFLFSLWRNIPSLIFLGFLAIIFYEIVFQKKWITPIIQEVITLLYQWSKQFVVWLYDIIITQGEILFWWIWDTIWNTGKALWGFVWSIVWDILQGLYSFTKEVLTDIFDLVFDFIKVIAGDLVGLIKEIITSIFSLIGEIFQGIFSIFLPTKKEEKES